MKKTLVLSGTALLVCGLVLAYLGQAELNSYAEDVFYTGLSSAPGIIMLVLGMIMAIGGAGLAVAGSVGYSRPETA